MSLGLRSLTKAGLDRMRDWHQDEKDGREPTVDPADLVCNPTYSKVVAAGFDPETISLPARRYEAGILIRDELEKVGVLGGDGAESLKDTGMWAWLTLAWREDLYRPGNKNRVGEVARWIPTFGNWRTEYRHLLAGPVLTLLAHQDDPSRTKVLLAGPLHKPGEAPGQLGASQGITTGPGLLDAATALYWDDDEDALRSGIAGTDNPGSLRRFAALITQLERTYDLQSMTGEEILSFLPGEFAVGPA